MSAAILSFRRKGPKLGKLASVLAIAVPLFYLWTSSSSRARWAWAAGRISTPSDRLSGSPQPQHRSWPTSWLTATIREPREVRIDLQSEGAGGLGRQFACLGDYVVAMNVLYLVFMSTPKILVRELFGYPNPFVP